MFSPFEAKYKGHLSPACPVPFLSPALLDHPPLTHSPRSFPVLRTTPQSDIYLYDGPTKSSLSKMTRDERIEARRNRTPVPTPPPPRRNRSPSGRYPTPHARDPPVRAKVKGRAGRGAAVWREKAGADGNDDSGGESQAFASAAEHFQSWTPDGDNKGAVAAATAAAATAAALLKRGETPLKREEAAAAECLLSGLATAFHPSPRKARQRSSGFGGPQAARYSANQQEGRSVSDRDANFSPLLTSSPGSGVKRISPMSSPLSSRMMTPHLSMDYHNGTPEPVEPVVLALADPSGSPGADDSAAAREENGAAGKQNGDDGAHRNGVTSGGDSGGGGGGDGVGTSIGDSASTGGRSTADVDAPTTPPASSSSLSGSVPTIGTGGSAAAEQGNGELPRADTATTSTTTNSSSSENGSSTSTSTSPTTTSCVPAESQPAAASTSPPVTVGVRGPPPSGITNNGDARANNVRRDTLTPVRAPTLAWNPPPLPGFGVGGLQSRSCKRRKMSGYGVSPSTLASTPEMVAAEGRAASASRRPSSAP